jgi:uncharacterized protein
MNLQVDLTKDPALAPIVSCFQALALEEGNRSGARQVQVSLDLGCSQTSVTLSEQGVDLGPGLSLSWDDLAYIRKHDNLCFEVHTNELLPIRVFSEQLGRTYQLMPTEHEPALLISGFVMHRFRDVTPAQGARAMVKAVLPFKGRLLDTATGLGYSVIEATKYASEVLTIELDPAATQMAMRNPASRALFVDPKITRLIGNSAEVIRSLPAEHFGAVVHDPPAINLAGELYSADFYAEALRVLQRGGKLFHYVGDPNSASGGRTTKGVVRRLQDAGFKKIVPKPQAFGVLALK